MERNESENEDLMLHEQSEIKNNKCTNSKGNGCTFKESRRIMFSFFASLLDQDQLLKERNWSNRESVRKKLVQQKECKKEIGPTERV